MVCQEELIKKPESFFITQDNVKFGIAVAILLFGIAFTYVSMNTSANTSTEGPAHNNEWGEIASWKSRDVDYDEAIIQTLFPDKVVYKTYQKEGSKTITLFIAFYNTLEKADMSHSPTVCFTGQGWDIHTTTKETLVLDSGENKEITITKMVQQKGDNHLISLHWYQAYDRSYHSRGMQKAFLYYYKLMGYPDHNAFVRVTMNFKANDNVEDTEAMINTFIKDMYPELRRFFN